MKSILSVLTFSACILATGCDNNTGDDNKTAMDSVGASSNPSSTAVLTDDSAAIKDADTILPDSLRH